MSAFFDRIKDLSRDRLALLAAELQQTVERSRASARQPVAIVGAAGRYPGAPTLDAFWSQLRGSRRAIGPAPAPRWPREVAHGARFDDAARRATTHGAYLADIDLFDAEFFGVSDRDAVALDPQQRALLEVTWHAFEDAGRVPDPARGLPAGVFVGVSTSDYADALSRSGTDWGGTLSRGTSHSLAAGRLSYALGLRGPSLAVDTACSSSLVAVHLACRSLRAGECDLAVAAGVNLIMSPLITVDLAQVGLLSPSAAVPRITARTRSPSRRASSSRFRISAPQPSPRT